ncbi:IS3 family transposase, partial [Escherichia coli]|nr:IS3 family transposase [Escherichia coli]
MRATVFNYIECDYNRWRRHSWCGGLSPEQFENKNCSGQVILATVLQ